jgi:hypothetical protein
VSSIEPDRRDLDIYDREQDIPEIEKSQILDQIDKSISESAVSSAPPVNPKKKGFVFPLIVNLAAMTLLIAVVFAALRVFEVRRERLNLETREVASAEGKILDEFKREAEERLREKDAAILRVLKQLGSLERERSQLSRIMELRIQEKEREMRRVLEAELLNRRESLRRDGLEAAEIERRLLALETEKKRQIFEELQAFQAEINSLTRRREQQLLREKEAARLSLEQATLEREELLISTQQEEMKLIEQIRPEGRIAVPVSAQDQWSDREALTVQERLVIDQIVSSYTVIAARVAGKRYEEALEELNGLEAIFVDDKVSGLPAVERRKSSDLRIIRAFRGLIAQATAAIPAEAPPADTTDAALIEDLRRELQEKDSRIAELEARPQSEPVETVDMERLVAEARSYVYGDVLRTVARFQAVSSEEELEALSRELGSEAGQPQYESLLAALQNLTTESLATQEPQAGSYRILGTVTLVGRNSITVLPIANMTLRVGTRIEVRRLADTGEASRIAVGTLTDVQGEKLVARIDGEQMQGGVKVTDKVYIIVD